MNSELPEFIKVQQGFANHIKNPNHVQRPRDVDDRHMAVYRDLFFNNVMGFLDGAFPVLAEILGYQRWQELGRAFFSTHQSVSPYFLHISQEFLSYLEREYEPKKNDPEYIFELAHYEWLELYVDVHDSEELAYNPLADPVVSVPILSPAVEGFLYQYPVHTISVQAPNVQAHPCALIVYRNRNDDVGFIETNALTLQMLALLKQGGASGETVVKQVLQESGLLDNPHAFAGGIETIRHWHQLGIILSVEN